MSLPTDNRNIISQKYSFKNKSHLFLNKRQIHIRDSIQDKLNNGTYRLEHAACLCGAMNDAVIAETDRYGLSLNTVACKRCGLLRTDPRLDGNSLNDFYVNEYRDLYMESPEVTENYFQDMFVRGNEILQIFRSSASSIDIAHISVLEIGCSAGGILLPFLRAGATVKGYDYDQRYLNYGNRLDASLNLCFGGLDNLQTERKHDLIILNHVLEHLPDPRKAIAMARNCLKERGYLYIGVPGLRNPAYYASPTKSFLGSLHIGHLYHFTEQSLIRIMEGFQVRYIDDKICALLQTAKMDYASEPEIVSEFISNIGFIRDYETSLSWKLKRLKMLIMNVLSRFIMRCIPIGVRKALRSLLNPVK